MKPLLLQALEGTNRTVPVWFMRQAGRYLPEYRAFKKHFTLNEMFHNPEIAARITCLPVDILNVDAAILFADILTLPSSMGFDIIFVDGKGPVVRNPVSTLKDIKKIHNLSGLQSVAHTIRLVNRTLPAEIPLIGFAGAPFSVLSYLVKGNHSLGLPAVVRFAITEEKAFHQMMEKLTSNTIAYLQLQQRAGIKVFQLFDSWAGILPAIEYKSWVLPYLKEIFRQVKGPSIYYLKNCHHLLPMMEETGADVLSVCETVRIGEDPVLNQTSRGIQGNFYNALLSANQGIIDREVVRILTAARRHHSKYIFNLSHGVFPDTKVETLKAIVRKVHQFRWRS